MGNPVYEYEYVDQYLKRSSFGLLCLDLWIIWKGIMVIVKGGGHWHLVKASNSPIVVESCL